jgi:DNA-binding NarL/FixJ family response regulator
MVSNKDSQASVDIDTVRVIIADDQLPTRRALKALLAFEPRIVIVGEAGSGDEVIRLVSEKQPDLVLMDVQIPLIDGLKATQVIKSNWPDIKVVVFTIFPHYQREAYSAGADFFMIKGSSDRNPAQVILSFFPTKDITNVAA